MAFVRACEGRRDTVHRGSTSLSHTPRPLHASSLASSLFVPSDGHVVGHVCRLLGSLRMRHETHRLTRQASSMLSEFRSPNSSLDASPIPILTSKLSVVRGPSPARFQGRGMAVHLHVWGASARFCFGTYQRIEVHLLPSWCVWCDGAGRCASRHESVSPFFDFASAFVQSTQRHVRRGRRGRIQPSSPLGRMHRRCGLVGSTKSSSHVHSSARRIPRTRGRTMRMEGRRSERSEQPRGVLQTKKSQEKRRRESRSHPVPIRRRRRRTWHETTQGKPARVRKRRNVGMGSQK